MQPRTQALGIHDCFLRYALDAPISLSHAMRPGLQSAIFGWQNYLISQILFQE